MEIKHVVDSNCTIIDICGFLADGLSVVFEIEFCGDLCNVVVNLSDLADDTPVYASQNAPGVLADSFENYCENVLWSHLQNVSKKYEESDGLF